MSNQRGHGIISDGKSSFILGNGVHNAHNRSLDGYQQGIRNLVKLEDLVPDNADAVYNGHGTRPNLNISRSKTPASIVPATRQVANFTLVPYQPLLKNLSAIAEAALPPAQQCFLDGDNQIPAPSTYAFHGIPQHGVEPLLGSYDVLGLRNDVCFERYGRYGPYGLGYATSKGGSGLGMHGDRSLTEPIWTTSGQINWSSVDVGDAQRRCFQRNQHRFLKVTQGNVQDGHTNQTTIPRTVLVLRAWSGLEYTPARRLYIRSLVNELSLYSGGEYDVHLLVEVKPKDSSETIWTSQRAYNEVLAQFVPDEFRSMATLWSEELMKSNYPGPFEPQFAFHGPMYTAMRSMHFALQWFMLQHPEYEYFWNWEIDLRYIGHYYELLDQTTSWAKKQSRDHLWERSARFYIPSLYENWDAFVQETQQKSPESIDESVIDNDEEADLITFDPIFDPAHTLWNRRLDVSGYNTSLPIPPRRASIVVANRFSRRLLLTMHNETLQKHSMASEMFPASMCLHHGLKAVYAPHPVYLDRDWPASFAQEIFNGGDEGQSGGYEDSVFGEGPNGNEHALLGTTYYYNARFAAVLWRRWMGYKEEGFGGKKLELRKGKKGVGGRMCLRSMLLHPVKRDVGRVN